MHLKPARTAAIAAAIGGVLVLGLGSAQAAKAKPVQYVRCNSNALGDAIGDGGTLYLTAGCTYRVPDTLTVSQNTTIYGYEDTLVGGGPRSDYSVLYVDCMKDLTLNGVNISEGSAEDGGAIDSAGNLTINGGVFSHNSGEDGGAIYTGSGGTMAISNAVFTGNEGEDGGAIWSDTDNPLLDGVHFGQNKADKGGALYLADTATVEDSSFLGDVASSQGGAIWNDGDLTLQNITDVAGSGNELEGNEAYLGGGIYNNDWVSVGETVINSNEAHHGGGIYNGCDGEPLVLTDATIVENVFDNIYYQDC